MNLALEPLGELVLRCLAEYLEACRRGDGPVLRLRPIQDLQAELQTGRWLREGGMTPGDLEGFLETYLHSTIRLHHPGYLGHQLAVPLVPSALADLVNAVTANGMAVYEMGPAAVAVELAVLDWMLGLVGWDRATAGGVLTHGGSLANLTCLVAARHALDPQAAERGTTRPLAVLAPASAHFSVGRAAMIMGLGRSSLVEIPTDRLGRIRPEGLPDALARARVQGREVVAVVASAGATATGLHDPLAAVGAFCREEGLWFHVDGAHGAAALLCPAERHLLDGVELADSLVWDAHKMLGTSALCTAVLLRRGAHLEAAFHSGAEYIGGDRNPAEGVDLIHRTVECTKWPLGLRVLLTLAFHGEQGMADHVARLYRVTRRFHDLIQARDGFACPCEPESNILCFRFTRAVDHRALRTALVRDGRFYITEAALDGQHHLRLVVMNPATDEATITALLDRLEELAG